MGYKTLLAVALAGAFLLGGCTTTAVQTTPEATVVSYCATVIEAARLRPSTGDMTGNNFQKYVPYVKTLEKAAVAAKQEGKNQASEALFDLARVHEKPVPSRAAQANATLAATMKAAPLISEDCQIDILR